MGSEDLALSLRGGRLPLPALLFPSHFDSAFFQLKLTLKPECSGSPEFFRFLPTQTHTQTRAFHKTVSAWDSNPGKVLLADPFNQLDKSVLLIATAVIHVNSRGREIRAPQGHHVMLPRQNSVRDRIHHHRSQNCVQNCSHGARPLLYQY